MRSQFRFGRPLNPTSHCAGAISSVKGTCSCHNLMRTPKREQILLHCTIWVTRKTSPSCLEGHRSVCPARTTAPTPSNSILSSPGLPHSALDTLSTLLRRDFPFAPRWWLSALFPPASALELRRRCARPRDSCWPIPTGLSARDFPIAPFFPWHPADRSQDVVHFFPVTRFCSIKKTFGQSTPILIPSSTLPMFHVHKHHVSPVLLKARPSKPSLTHKCGQYSRSILIFTISTDLVNLKNHSIVTKAR